MGIQVEFNPDLALRNISEYEKGRRRRSECIPKNLQEGKVYSFLKKGQRNYWLNGEIPLLETKGNQNLSRPKASVRILEAVHFMQKGELFTKGKYRVIKVFPDNQIYFEGFQRIKKERN